MDAFATQGGASRRREACPGLYSARPSAWKCNVIRKWFSSAANLIPPSSFRLQPFKPRCAWRKRTPRGDFELWLQLLPVRADTTCIRSYGLRFSVTLAGSRPGLLLKVVDLASCQSQVQIHRVPVSQTFLEILCLAKRQTHSKNQSTHRGYIRAICSSCCSASGRSSAWPPSAASVRSWRL